MIITISDFRGPPN